MQLYSFQSDQTEASSSAAASSSSQLPSPMSLVSRARTALHSAAAKAEKVITEIKADLKSDREGDSQSLRESRRSSEQDLGRDSANNLKEEVSLGEFTLEEVNANASDKLRIPPASAIKQLAAAFENVKKHNSINDLSALDTDSSLSKEKTGFRFSVVKSIVRREKENKLILKSGDEDFSPLIQALFYTEEQHNGRRNVAESETLPIAYLSKEIRGAPLESFVVQLSEIIGGFKSLQKMASFWGYVVVELRKLWADGQPIPHMPLDSKPDLNSCHLQQQLQVINCCIARKHRRVVATESLESVLKEANLDITNSVDISQQKHSPSNIHYARISSGNYVLRLGAGLPSESLTMLETGETIYSPITQEGPVLTEELIKETEEFVLRTGSVGAGCSQLLSDMQAFKAANPGCVLEDFVRWYSPPDWLDMEIGSQANESADAEGSSRRGRLSARMQKEGNLWRELWESAKPLPAIKQAPLFDEDLAVDSILNDLEDIQPCELFEQLFFAMLCAGFTVAETLLPRESNLSKLFQECKDYITTICQNGLSSGNIGDICKVYETVETITVHPEQAIMIMSQPEEAVSPEAKGLFKKINLNFITKDRQLLRRKASKGEMRELKDEKKPNEKSGSKDDKKPDEKHKQAFSNLFEKKRASLFSRKNQKPPVPASEPDSLDDNDWTIV